MSMIKAEFGIIECFDECADYTEYVPERYQCVAIDDEKYLNWIKPLLLQDLHHLMWIQDF